MRNIILRIIISFPFLNCYFLIGKKMTFKEAIIGSTDQTLEKMFTVKPSITSWDTIETPKRISLVSMAIEHHSDGVISN